MEIINTGIEGLVEIEPKVFGDSRGYFFESYRKDVLNDNGIDLDFVQSNQSFSVKGTLRGLHYQKGDHAQDKLVRVMKGRVLDVAVDLRHESPTFGKFHTVILDAERHNMFLVPVGFAHGFLALEDCVFTYQCSNYYNKESEGGIMWNDPEIGIYWDVENPLVSDKDQELLTFEQYKADPAF